MDLFKNIVSDQSTLFTTHSAVFQTYQSIRMDLFKDTVSDQSIHCLLFIQQFFRHINGIWRDLFKNIESDQSLHCSLLTTVFQTYQR